MSCLLRVFGESTRRRVEKWTERKHRGGKQRLYVLSFVDR